MHSLQTQGTMLVRGSNVPKALRAQGSPVLSMYNQASTVLSTCGIKLEHSAGAELELSSEKSTSEEGTGEVFSTLSCWPWWSIKGLPTNHGTVNNIKLVDSTQCRECL